MKAPEFPTSQEIARRFQDKRSRYYFRHGLKEHERRLFAVYEPPGTVTTDNVDPTFAVTEILPTPRITNMPLDSVVERAGQGLEAVRLQKYYVEAVSREFFDGELRPSFWLVLQRDQIPEGEVPTSADITTQVGTSQDSGTYKYPRFQLLGTPEPFETAYRITLVERRN